MNSKKTKFLIFEKKIRKSTLHKQCFQINNDKIEIVNNYTYLGINFSTNRNFEEHKINSKEKSRRSFFAIRRYLDFSKVLTDIATNVFVHFSCPFFYTVLKCGAFMIKTKREKGKSKKRISSFAKILWV